VNEKRANTQSSIPTNTPPMSHDCSDQSYSYTQAWAYWAGGRQPPQFVGQTKSVGQYSLNSRAILAYYKKNGTNSVNFVGNFIISEKLVWCFEKFWYVRKIFGPLKWYTDRNFFGDRGGEVVKINYVRKNFLALVGQNPKKSGKFVSAPLIFSFRYAHAHKCDHYTSLKWSTC
jgi:hypothetical protein